MTDLLRKYCLLAGIFFLLTIAGGGFGELYVPSHLIVSADAAATFRNIPTSHTLFRVGFAAYLIEAVCDIAIAWVFFLLLRPVREDAALLAVFFGLASTITFAFAEFFYFAASFFVGNAKYLSAFTTDQRSAFTYLSLKAYGVGGTLFGVFYGLGWLIRGCLMFRSDYFPKWLGVLVAAGGVGFITQNFLVVLQPAYASDLFVAPMAAAALTMTVWLFAAGLRKQTG